MGVIFIDRINDGIPLAGDCLIVFKLMSDVEYDIKFISRCNDSNPYSDVCSKKEIPGCIVFYPKYSVMRDFGISLDNHSLISSRNSAIREKKNRVFGKKKLVSKMRSKITSQASHAIHINAKSQHQVQVHMNNEGCNQMILSEDLNNRGISFLPTSIFRRSHRKQRNTSKQDPVILKKSGLNLVLQLESEFSSLEKVSIFRSIVLFCY